MAIFAGHSRAAHVCALVVLMSCSGRSEVGERPKAVITVDDNGYGNILVAIHPDVSLKDHPTIVDDLKTHLTEFSASLFEATNHRLYIHNVTILIPEDWDFLPVPPPATTEFFDKANIRVIKNESDTPYVRQSQGCGKGGDFISLSDNFVTDVTIHRDTFGGAGRTLVHEWGHYRWGLFDEYPATGQPVYYGTYDPVQCGLGQLGDYINQDGMYCEVDEKLYFPLTNESCHYELDDPNAPTTSTVSMMFIHYFSHITGFCDNTPGDDSTHHNADAPNTHNTKCDGRSCWEVMREHPDFSGGANPPIAPLDTTPIFSIVQQVKRRYVLVLDVSNSMNVRQRSRESL